MEAIILNGLPTVRPDGSPDGTGRSSIDRIWTSVPTSTGHHGPAHASPSTTGGPARSKIIYKRTDHSKDVRASVPVAIAVVLLLMASSTGCLSLYATKDALRFTEERPTLKYGTVTAFTFSWAANGVVRPDTIDEPPRNIQVKAATRYLQVAYKVNIVSGFVARQIGIDLPINPEITLRLRTPAGMVIWEGNFTESDEDTRPFQGPSAGLWVLHIEGQGYGGEAFGASVHDTLWVEVKLYEPL